MRIGHNGGPPLVELEDEELVQNPERTRGQHKRPRQHFTDQELIQCREDMLRRARGIASHYARKVIEAKYGLRYGKPSNQRWRIGREYEALYAARLADELASRRPMLDRIDRKLAGRAAHSKTREQR